MFTPLFSPRGEHSLSFRRMEGWTENLPLGDNFAPGSQKMSSATIWAILGGHWAIWSQSIWSPCLTLMICWAQYYWQFYVFLFSNTYCRKNGNFGSNYVQYLVLINLSWKKIDIKLIPVKWLAISWFCRQVLFKGPPLATSLFTELVLCKYFKMALAAWRREHHIRLKNRRPGFDSLQVSRENIALQLCIAY
jgi:hypothetical protein